MNEFAALISTVPTKRDLNQFLTSLEKTERGLFRVSSDVDTFFAEQFSARVASSLSTYAEFQKVNLSDPSSASEFLRSVRSDLQKVPIVTLRVAFEPTRAQIEKFSLWFSEHFSRSVIFEFKFDPRVIGGAVIESEGKVGDFSLLKKIDTYLRS